MEKGKKGRSREDINVAVEAAGEWGKEMELDWKVCEEEKAELKDLQWTGNILELLRLHKKEPPEQLCLSERQHNNTVVTRTRMWGKKTGGAKHYFKRQSENTCLNIWAFFFLSFWVTNRAAVFHFKACLAARMCERVKCFIILVAPTWWAWITCHMEDLLSSPIGLAASGMCIPTDGGCKLEPPKYFNESNVWAQGR